MFWWTLPIKLKFQKFAPSRGDSDSEVKIVKTPGARSIFGVSNWVSRGRRRDCDTLQNAWQAQRFRHSGEDVRWSGCWMCGSGAILRFWTCQFSGIIARCTYKTSYASVDIFSGRRSTLHGLEFWHQVCGRPIIFEGGLTEKLSSVFGF